MHKTYRYVTYRGSEHIVNKTIACKMYRLISDCLYINHSLAFPPVSCSKNKKIILFHENSQLGIKVLIGWVRPHPNLILTLTHMIHSYLTRLNLARPNLILTNLKTGDKKGTKEVPLTFLFGFREVLTSNW